MEQEFLLSVVIPTKNRQKYIIKAVEQIFQINDSRIQVIVQDNSDTNILSDMLSVFNDNGCLKYNYTKETLSFVDNFSMAVSMAEGEYVCIIGDDDGIMPQIVDVTEWASKNGIDAVKPEISAVYFWPDSEAVGSRQDNGYMSISKITGAVKMCTPYNEVSKLLHNGCQKYLALNMVKLYHGIVKKECLDNVKKQTGRYFGGLSPDIYIAVALSLTVNKVVEIDFPLTISGICNKSGSANSVTGKHTGRLEDAPHFRGHDAYKWSELVPRFYSVETIWADSALAALKDLDKKELISKFNIAALTAYCMKKYPQFSEVIMENYKKFDKDNSNLRVWVSYIQFPAIDFTRRVFRRIKRRNNDVVRINDVVDILKAGDILQKRLNHIGINVEVVLKSLERTLSI